MRHSRLLLQVDVLLAAKVRLAKDGAFTEMLRQLRHFKGGVNYIAQEVVFPPVYL